MIRGPDKKQFPSILEKGVTVCTERGIQPMRDVSVTITKGFSKSLVLISSISRYSNIHLSEDHPYRGV